MLPLLAICLRLDGIWDYHLRLSANALAIWKSGLARSLFQRTTRQLKLTETGEGFYERVVGILADIEEAEAFVSQLNAKANGTLRITAPTAFSRMHIAPHLASFMRPASRSDHRDASDRRDRRYCRRGHGSGDPRRRAQRFQPRGPQARALPANVICGAPDYLNRHGRPKTLADLAKHNCLTAGYQQVWRLEGPDGVETVRSPQTALQLR